MRPLEVEVEVRGVDDRRVDGRAGLDVVAVEGDVDVAERDRVTRELADEGVKAAGDDRSASVDADDRECLGGVLLDDLVRNPHQRAAQIITVEYDLFRFVLTRPFLVSQDLVKGTDVIESSKGSGGRRWRLRSRPRACAMIDLVPPARMQMPAGRPVRDPSRLREIDRDVNDAIARHSAAGIPVRGRRRALVCAAAGRGRRSRAAPWRSDLVVSLPEGAAGSSRPGVARHGLRLPGQRALPTGRRPFDYSWSGLARWTGEAIDALELDRVHLVVHDIGGPIGFEWAIHNPDRVLSVTVLNTVLDVDGFKRPWPMAPFAVQGLGEVWLRLSPRLLFSEIFYSQGIAERSRVPRSQVYAHIALLRLHDRGRAFLEIMRGFELGREKEQFFREGLADRPSRYEPCGARRIRRSASTG